MRKTIVSKKYRDITGVAGAGIFCFAILFFGSCNGNNNKGTAQGNVGNRGKLIGSWHAVRVENRETDEFYSRMQLFLDTFGKNNDAATNMRLYNTTNIDSLRKESQIKFDSTKFLKEQEITGTSLTFNPDSLVYLSFGGALDTSKWSLGADNILTLEDMNTGMQHEKITWEVVELTDTSLVVKMTEDTTYSKVTFHPEGK